MPSIYVHLDINDFLHECSDSELKEIINSAGHKLHKLKPYIESDFKPKDIHIDVGRRELRELIDKTLGLSRHALYVAADIGL